MYYAEKINDWKIRLKIESSSDLFLFFLYCGKQQTPHQYFINIFYFNSILIVALFLHYSGRSQNELIEVERRWATKKRILARKEAK
jgi:hypothetical protein